MVTIPIRARARVGRWMKESEKNDAPIRAAQPATAGRSCADTPIDTAARTARLCTLPNNIGGTLERDMRDTPGQHVALAVDGPEGDDGAGWVVARRDNQA